MPQENNNKAEKNLVHLPSDRPDARYLSEKVFDMFEYVHKHYLQEADWFLKADDDTYVIIDNLRHQLQFLDSENKIIIGRHFPSFSLDIKRNITYGFLSGGAGYVLSKATLRTFGKEIASIKQHRTTNIKCVPVKGTAEDVSMARCLQSIGVKIENSLDENKKQTFHPFNLASHLFSQFPEWYERYDKKNREDVSKKEHFSST